MNIGTYYYFSVDATALSGATYKTYPQNNFTTLRPPPVISNVQVKADQVHGIIASWVTDVLADGMVRLNTDQSQLGTGTDLVFYYPNYYQDRKVRLNGLLPNTTYYYTISSTKSAITGTTTTPAASYTTPEPITISNVEVDTNYSKYYSIYNANVIRFHWATNISATHAVAYSNSDPTLQVSNGSTGFAVSGSTTVHDIYAQPGADKTYWYKVMSVGSNGEYGESPISSFTAPAS